MFEKIQKYKNDARLKLFMDSRVLGVIGFGIIALLVSWSSVKTIQTNYELQKKISRLEQENRVTELGNENIRLQNEYLDTDEFLELAARRQFGKATEGETVVLVPKQVAMTYVDDLSVEDKEQASPETSKSRYQKNFESWINFFLNRKKSSQR